MPTSPNLEATHLDANTSQPSVVLNESLDLVDEAMNGYIAINFASDADYTLSTASDPEEWQYGVINMTDTGVVLTTGRNVIVPDNERVYNVINSTAQTLTFKTSGGTGIAVTAGNAGQLYCDGTNVEDLLVGAGGSDADAIHDNVAGEIAALTTVTAAAGDYILIEDVSDSNNKKKILASDLLGAGTDNDAIHDNVASEISALTTVTPESGDYILIEDVSDSNNKKKITVGAISGSTPTESLIIPCSDESTALTTGTAKITFRMPYAFTLTDVRASLTGAGSTSGTTTIDINENGTTILSTKLTIDQGEKTSTTAATAAVISDSSLADDAEITIDIDAVTGGADETGLKVTLIGTQT